jgi:small multidrug resistance pump
MSWICLGLAIVCEIVATTFLKMSVGLTRPGPAAVVVAGYVAAFGLLALALRTIEVGIAYAIWSGVGTAVVAALGIALFGESVSGMKILGLGLIVAGVISLHLAGRPA